MKVIISQEQLEYMSIVEEITLSSYTFGKKFDYGMKLMNKGTEKEYLKVPYALFQIDLSHKRFKGRIPALVGDLKSLILLKFSSNVLIGSILPSLANLTVMKSLDLS